MLHCKQVCPVHGLKFLHIVPYGREHYIRDWSGPVSIICFRDLADRVASNELMSFRDADTMCVNIDVKYSQRQSLLSPQSAAVNDVDIYFILFIKIGIKNGFTLVICEGTLFRSFIFDRRNGIEYISQYIGRIEMIGYGRLQSELMPPEPPLMSSIPYRTKWIRR